MKKQALVLLIGMLAAFFPSQAELLQADLSIFGMD
jgi:hypothetical protein